jgi:flagellar basal body rod protein FlgG
LDTTQGRVVATGIPLHLAILGEGFFCVEGEQFTRDGRMQLRDEVIRTSHGAPLLAYKLDEKGNIAENLSTIRFPLDPDNQLYVGRYNEFSFDALGNFLGGVSNVDPITGHLYTDFTPLYRLAIATFPQPHRLVRQPSGLLSPGTESGRFKIGLAAQQRVGFLVPRSLELSNVDPVQQSYIWGRLDGSELKAIPSSRAKSGGARKPAAK